MLEPAITRPHHRELRKRALNPGGSGEMARYAEQRVLGRLIGAFVRFLKRPADVRIDVGISHRDVNDSDARGFEPADKANRLGEVHFHRVIGVQSEPPSVGQREIARTARRIASRNAIRYAVVDPQPAGE